tara:strand:- start:8102 stop:9109 length:1008 start_codon:yes stop_codon:yes gene_type:complete
VHAQNIPAPKSYIAHKTPFPITIDGLGDEEAWQASAWSDEFIDIEGKKTPQYKTQVKMLWDEQYLYFFAKLEEPHIWATLKQRDTVIFYNNDFEIFLDPDGDTHHYMEFEMNAHNTLWDLMLTKAYRDGGRPIDNWDIKGIKTAVHINGTFNDPTDIDTCWTVEIAMPWEALNEAQAKQGGKAGEFWRINFSRVNWDYDLINGKYYRKQDANGKFLPEYNWVWSPQWVINMHEPEHWGYVYFSGSAPGESDSFTIPQDEQLRWALYEAFAEIKNRWKAKNGLEHVKEFAKTPLNIGGKQVTITVEKTASGWNISAQSPFTKKQYAITQDGKYVEL